jgi:hypothetical protein
MLKITQLTDSERVDVLPLALPYLAKEYNWSHATPWITRVAIDLYVERATRPAP